MKTNAAGQWSSHSPPHAKGRTGTNGTVYIDGVARQPAARGMLQNIAILGFALAEALAIIGIGLAYTMDFK